MQVTIMKNQSCGDKSLSLNMLLQDEPLALYVAANGSLSLKLRGGTMLTLISAVDCSHLVHQEEVTIESFVGGFLAAGYRVGIRSAA
jgi:hypothetical protein